MARTFTYLIYRHGSNAANQSMTPVAPIGFVEAPNRAEAERIAVERWTFYNNQTPEAVPQSKARASDWNAVNEAEAMEALYGGYDD